MYLVYIKLHVKDRHVLIHSAVVPGSPINSFWYKLENNIKVHLILLCSRMEGMLQLHNVWVAKQLHNLQFPVLISPILKHLLYSHGFTRFKAFSLHHKPH